MAIYKIIQNIEARDQLIWKLDLRQFIYALVAATLVFIGYLIGAQIGFWFLVLMVILCLPFVFLAIPLNRDQPNDVWLLARLNFLLRPRLRLWSQLGNSYKFLIVKAAFSDSLQTNISQPASSSELQAQIQNLSSLLDSRGRSIKQSSHQAWEHQHEKQRSFLSERFKKLLKHQHTLKKKKIDQHFKHKARRQLQGLSRPSTPRQSFSPNQIIALRKNAEFDTMKLNQLEDLKISTLEKMINQDSLKK